MPGGTRCWSFSGLGLQISELPVSTEHHPTYTSPCRGLSGFIIGLRASWKAVDDLNSFVELINVTLGGACRVISNLWQHLRQQNVISGLNKVPAHLEKRWALCVVSKRVP